MTNRERAEEFKRRHPRGVTVAALTEVLDEVYVSGRAHMREQAALYTEAQCPHKRRLGACPHGAFCMADLLAKHIRGMR